MPPDRSPRSTPALWLRRLDFLPPWAAWALGLGGGALAGSTLAGMAPGLIGILGFLVLLGAAAGLAASGEPIAVLEQAVRSVKSPLVDLVEIPGGSFLMGSPRNEEGRSDDEEPAHSVRISPFACMRFPVTRRLYDEILGQDPGWPKGEENDRPINYISWFDAAEFCNRLSERAGLEPCYQVDGNQVEWNRTSNGYRLLTEAEWEYACRAGTTSRWSFGEDVGDVRKFTTPTWLGYHSSHLEPYSVGRLRPNAWGLHDMHGNVLEWCWDWYGSYTGEWQIDPVGPLKGNDRILRGGAFHHYSSGFLRSAHRFKFHPSKREDYIGFRCALSPRRQP